MSFALFITVVPIAEMTSGFYPTMTFSKSGLLPSFMTRTGDATVRR